MRAYTIVDCETVPVLTLEEELHAARAKEWAQVRQILDQEAERDLTEKLTKSIQNTCTHAGRIKHHEGRRPDTGEWFSAYHCESCGSEWTEYE